MPTVQSHLSTMEDRLHPYEQGAVQANDRDGTSKVSTIGDLGCRKSTYLT